MIKLESLQPLLHMLTDEQLTLIVQQNLGPRVIGIKVHLRQSKGTLALWKPIRNTKFDEIQAWKFRHFFVEDEDQKFSPVFLVFIRGRKLRKIEKSVASKSDGRRIAQQAPPRRWVFSRCHRRPETKSRTWHPACKQKGILLFREVCDSVKCVT